MIRERLGQAGLGGLPGARPVCSNSARMLFGGRCHHTLGHMVWLPCVVRLVLWVGMSSPGLPGVLRRASLAKVCFEDWKTPTSPEGVVVTLFSCYRRQRRL